MLLRGGRALALVALLLAAGCRATPPATPGPVAAEAPPSAVVDAPTSTTSAPAPVPTPTPQRPTAAPSVAAAEDSEARVAELVASLTDEQLAGQLLMVAVHGGAADEVDQWQAAANRRLYGVDTPAEVMATLEPGGIILMGAGARDDAGVGIGTGNVADPAQVPAFVGGLQAAAAVPLLVAIDQEHGPVARLGPPFSRFPAAMGIGAAGDPVLARRVAAASARELAAAGINVNLAPVADVNTEPANPVIGVRSLGEDPGHSSALVAAQVAGIQQDAGIAATAKHFPGHGDTTLDSHDGLPTVDATLAELEDGALRPFRAAVDAGVDVVMPGHLLLPAVDPAGPATLSSQLLQDVLRGQLGFDGVVVSDAMNMAAIRGGDDAATAVAAVAAGIDVVLLSPDPVGTRAAIIAAMADGTLDREQIVAAVSRILRLKDRLGLLTDVPAATLPAPHVLARHDALAVRAAARSITVLDGQCPPVLTGDVPVRVTGDDAARLGALLAAAGVPVSAGADVAVVLWDGRGSPPAAADGIVVATGSPYSAGRVTQHRSLLLTYGDGEAALRGLVAALRSGRFSATTPVTIPAEGSEDIAVGTGIDCP